jgi:hypothetical protein
MLMKNQKRKSLLSIVCLVFVCFFAYQYWVKAETTDSQLVSTNNTSSGGVGDETLQILSELRTLILDEDIFTDEAFKNLKDFSMEIQEQPIGRNNPFSLVGSDGEYVAVGMNPRVVECEDEACFKNNFVNCSPAKIDLQTEGISGLVGQEVVYQYEIVGLKNDFCEVKSRFIKNPNQDWLGKEMSCQYDSSKDFDIAVKDMNRCEGELYILMSE